VQGPDEGVVGKDRVDVGGDLATLDGSVEDDLGLVEPVEPERVPRLGAGGILCRGGTDAGRLIYDNSHLARPARSVSNSRLACWPSGKSDYSFPVPERVAGAAAKCRAPADFRDSAAKPEASDTSHAGLRVPARLPVLPAGTEGRVS